MYNDNHNHNMVTGSANIVNGNPNFNFPSGLGAVVHYNPVTNFAGPTPNAPVYMLQGHRC